MSLRPWLVLLLVGQLLAQPAVATAIEKKEAAGRPRFHTFTGPKQAKQQDAAPAAAADWKGEDDGTLPAVPEVMGSTFEGFGTLAQQLSSEADSFAAEVHRLQQDETDRMARMKAELEQALKDTATDEGTLAAKNKRLEADVEVMRSEIKTLRQKSKELRGRLSAAAKALQQEQGGSAAGASPPGKGGRQRGPRRRAAPDPPAQQAPVDGEGGPEDAAGSGGGPLDASALSQVSSMEQRAPASQVSHVPAEEAEAGSEMFNQVHGLATGLGQMLRLERRAEARYQAMYAERMASRKRRVAQLKAVGKRLQSKLISMRRKRDKLQASLERLKGIYRGLAKAPIEQ